MGIKFINNGLVRISLFCGLFLTGLISNSEMVFCALFLVFSVLLIIKSRRSLLMFVSALIIGYSNYSIVVQRYIFPESLVINTDLFEYNLLSIRIMFVFMFCLLVFLETIKSGYKDTKLNYDYFDSNYTFSHEDNKAIIAICTIALIIIWIFFFDFKLGTKSGYSPIYEYSLVFFIIGFYYSGESKNSKVVIALLAVFYIVFDFLGGQRSTGIQILIVLVLMVFTKYLNTRRIIVGASILLVLITFIGLYRGSFSTTGINFGSVITYLRNGGGGYATAGFAYYTSLTFIGTIQYFSIVERLQQFCQFLASQFVIGTIGQPLIQISRQYFTHYNGGVLPIYIFYYTGYFGVAIISLLVSKYYKLMLNIDNKSSGYATVLCVYIASTTHRWYLYSPSQLLRGALLMLLVFWALRHVNKITKKK